MTFLQIMETEDINYELTIMSLFVQCTTTVLPSPAAVGIPPPGGAVA